MAVSPHLALRQGSGGRPGPGPGLGAMWGRPWCMGQGTSQGPHSARWERWATGGGGPITGGRRRESPTLITLTPRGPRAASSGAFAPAGARETPRTPAPAAASQRISGAASTCAQAATVSQAAVSFVCDMGSWHRWRWWAGAGLQGGAGGGVPDCWAGSVVSEDSAPCSPPPACPQQAARNPAAPARLRAPFVG